MRTTRISNGADAIQSTSSLFLSVPLIHCRPLTQRVRIVAADLSSTWWSSAAVQKKRKNSNRPIANLKKLAISNQRSERATQSGFFFIIPNEQRWVSDSFLFYFAGKSIFHYAIFRAELSFFLFSSRAAPCLIGLGLPRRFNFHLPFQVLKKRKRL